MTHDTVFYTNESFMDLETREYQVARIERDVAGYDVVALWHTAQQAREHVDKLNAGLGVSPDDVLTVVASSMAKSNALRGMRGTTDDSFDVVFPVRFTLRAEQVASLKERAAFCDEPEPNAEYSIAQAFTVVFHNDPQWLFGDAENSGRLLGWTNEIEWANLPSDGEVLAS